MKAHNNCAILAAGLCLALTWLARNVHAQGGTPLWTNRYDGPAHSYDFPIGIAVNKDGVVFVSGYSCRTNDCSATDCATLAYSNDGIPLWTNRFHGPGNVYETGGPVGVNSNGDFIVSVASLAGSPANRSAAITTIKYSSTGIPLWTNEYPAGTNAAGAYTIAVDRSDNIIVTGTANYLGNYGGDGDYVIIAYSNSGTALWTNRYNGPANGEDDARAVAVDGNGNVYVTGSSEGSGTLMDYATVAYSSAGVPLWTNRYDDPGNYADLAMAVVTDESGNVFVTGSSERGGNSSEFATVAYSNAGIPLWTNRYHGPSNYVDGARAIGVDAKGNIFVTGTSTVDGHSGYGTLGYSGEGIPLWTNFYAGADPFALTVDRFGNVFVGGGAGIIAYSNCGVPLWTNRYVGPVSGLNTVFALSADNSGNIFATGQSQGPGSPDYAIIKYSSSVPPPPHLDFQRLNDQLVLCWTNSLFTLQSAPSLADTFTNIPDAISPYTNAMTGPQQFFRLKGP